MGARETLISRDTFDKRQTEAVEAFLNKVDPAGIRNMAMGMSGGIKSVGKPLKSISRVAKTVLEPPGSSLSGIAHGKEIPIKSISNVAIHKGTNIDASIFKTSTGKFRVILHGKGDKSFIDAGALLRKEGNRFIIENVANNKTILNAIRILGKVIKGNLGKIIVDKGGPRIK